MRNHNEDSLVVCAPLYAVADGMGGHAAGEVASELTTDVLAQNAHTIKNADDLIATVRTINRAIIEAAERGLGRPGMGTTLTAALVDGTRLLLAQVGDSRAYLLHRRKLEQLTRDHSYVGELLAGGHISLEEAASHPKRSVITRALGSDPKTEADIYELEAQVGDRLLICSDGLYGMVRDKDISAILNSESDPQAAADALVAAARVQGGLDNISVVVLDIQDGESKFLTFSNEQGTGVQARGRGGSRGTGQRVRNKSTRRLSKGRLGVITFLVLLILLVGGAVGSLYWYAWSSAFVRAEGGVVAVYRGLPGEVLPGVRLEWQEYETTLQVPSLPSITAERLEDGIRVDSLNEAASLIASYEEQVGEQEAPPRESVQNTTQQSTLRSKERSTWRGAQQQSVAPDVQLYALLRAQQSAGCSTQQRTVSAAQNAQPHQEQGAVRS